MFARRPNESIRKDRKCQYSSTGSVALRAGFETARLGIKWPSLPPSSLASR
jgi:hypothetical protein